jgi:hypothetical protein
MPKRQQQQKKKSLQTIPETHEAAGATGSGDSASKLLSHTCGYGSSDDEGDKMGDDHSDSTERVVISIQNLCKGDQDMLDSVDPPLQCASQSQSSKMVQLRLGRVCSFLATHAWSAVIAAILVFVLVNVLVGSVYDRSKAAEAELEEQIRAAAERMWTKDDIFENVTFSTTNASAVSMNATTTMLNTTNHSVLY